MSEKPGWTRARRWLCVGALAVAAVPAGWMLSDAVERNNDFCNACHLPSGAILHEPIRRDFDGRPPMNLAARHAVVVRADLPDEDRMRCIDCHGGVGLLGRAEVKLLAARDTLVYLSGDFDEPSEMSQPLKDADCRQCHASFDETPSEFQRPRFHELGVHNVSLGLDCVQCHTSHEPGDPDFYFLDAAIVRARCASCHSEFGNEGDMR